LYRTNRPTRPARDQVAERLMLFSSNGLLWLHRFSLHLEFHTRCVVRPAGGGRREQDVTRFIIHIGPHKTGTTYIQETLAALRGALLERGICVPSIWNASPGLPSHMQVVWAIRNGDLTVIQEQVQEILAQRHEYVVISCEALSRLDQKQIVQLRQLLGSAPVQVVYYVRRWPERLPSLWQEAVKFGFTDTFPEFLAKQLTRYDISELRDTVMIDRFAAVFGASRVKVVSYSHLTERSLDIASHFLASCLGVSDVELPAAGLPNQSLPILDTELIRALNAVHARYGYEKSPALRNWFLSHREGLVPDTVLDAMRRCLDTIRLDEAAPPFFLPLQDLLTRYGPSIVPPHHANGLHALRAIDAAFVRPDFLLEPSVSKVLHEIYTVYRDVPEATKSSR
jgi:hypothetical protein